MNRCVMFVLLASGCYDFDRIERIDGSPGGDAGMSHDLDAGPSADLAPPTCTGLANHTWHIASSSSLNDFTSIVADPRLPASTVWAATSAAEVVQLQLGAETQSFNAASLFAYNSVAQIALDPMDGVVLAASDAGGDMQPLLMSMDGSLTNTTKLTERATWAGVAVTASAGTLPGSVLAATFSSDTTAQGQLDSFPRPHGTPTRVLLGTQLPRHVTTTPDGVVACGTGGLFATWSGTLWAMKKIAPPDDDCVYLASAALANGYRLAYVDGTSGDVCVSDDALTSVSCTPTASDTFAVAIVPCDPDTLVALAPHSVHISTDGGRTWLLQGMGSTTLTATNLAITADGVLYIVGTGGAYVFYQ